MRDLNKDLKVLLPHIVADTVSYEHSNKLVQLAQHFYSVNDRFASRIKDTDEGRDTLKAFMQHWFDGFTKTGKWIDGTISKKGVC